MPPVGWCSPSITGATRRFRAALDAVYGADCDGPFLALDAAPVELQWSGPSQPHGELDSAAAIASAHPRDIQILPAHATKVPGKSWSRSIRR